VVTFVLDGNVTPNPALVERLQVPLIPGQAAWDAHSNYVKPPARASPADERVLTQVRITIIRATVLMTYVELRRALRANTTREGLETILTLASDQFRRIKSLAARKARLDCGELGVPEAVGQTSWNIAFRVKGVRAVFTEIINSLEEDSWTSGNKRAFIINVLCLKLYPAVQRLMFFGERDESESVSSI